MNTFVKALAAGAVGAYFGGKLDAYIAPYWTSQPEIRKAVSSGVVTAGAFWAISKV